MVPVIDQGRVYCRRWVRIVNRAERTDFPERDLNMVAAGVEPEVDTTTIGVYEDLPNVYRTNDILMLIIQSLLND